MSYYPLTSWILFFFTYCFFGWCWECFYVSTKESVESKQFKFINRGFLHGPVIPIYGFAAITILITTIKVKRIIPLVYLIGAIAATLFELITGSIMEKIFKIKYWDYSNFPLNFRGYICLFASMFWGLASIVLIRVVHNPIENLIMNISPFVSELIAFMLVAIFTFDFHSALNEAISLKDVLELISKSNTNILRRLERRIDATVAFSLIFYKAEAIKLLRRNPTLISIRYKEAMEQLRNVIDKK